MKQSFDPEILLEHVAWMKRLARSLVRDETRADDLVQQTLLAAVEKPPRESRTVPAWLKTVLRNFAARGAQAEARRRRRERDAARPVAAAPVAADVLERAEVQRQLVELVFALEEPFRRIILLRFFEELSPRAIADIEHVDVSTVRRWLREALPRLRRRLDSRHGGDRRAWQLALLPVFDPGAGLRAATSAGRSCGAGLAARSLFYGVIMNLKTTALIGLLLIVAAVLVLTRSSDPGDSTGDRISEADADPGRAGVELSVVESVGEPAALAAQPEATGPVVRGSEISGTVRDSETGEPIPAARIKLGDRVVETDAEGAYRIGGLDEGEKHLTATADEHAERDAHVHLPGDDAARQDFELDPAIELLVAVVDEHDRPVAGADIQAMGIKEGFIIDLARTGEDGTALVTGISRLKLPTLVVRKTGYTFDGDSRGEFEIEPEAGTGEIRISLRTVADLSRVITGTIADPQGHPLPGITVQWVARVGRQSPRDAVVTDENGVYTLEFEHEREDCQLAVYGEGSSPRVLTEVRTGTPEVPAVVDFTLEPAHWLEGRVVDEDDRPVAGARVRAMPRAEVSFWAFPQIAREATTDTRGEFRLEGLAGPTVALDIREKDSSPASLDHVEVDRKTTFILRSRGVIRGRVVDAENGEPVPVFNVKLVGGGGYRVHRREPGESFTSAAGRFVLDDLHRNNPFDLKVEADGYSPAVLREVPARREREPGEVTVRLAGLRPLAGVVFDEASRDPIAGARVELALWDGKPIAWGRQQLERQVDTFTAADGAFHLEEGEPDTLFLEADGYSRRIIRPEQRPAYADRTGKLWIPLGRGETLSGKYFPDGPAKGPSLGLARQLSFPGRDGAARIHLGLTLPDDRGRFEWRNLDPGTYLVWATRGTGEPTFTEVARMVRIETGVPAVFDLGNDLGEHVFTGRLVHTGMDRLRRPAVTLRPTFDWHYVEFVADIRSEADPRFRIEGLRRGEYEVEVKAYDWDAPRPLPALIVDGDTERDLEVHAEE